MKQIQKFLAGSWIILGLLTAFPGLASANGNLTIVVKNPNPYTGNQSWFTFEKKTGETINDTASVKNLSDKPVKAHVYAVDATSNDSGSFILKLENEEKTGIGKWTTVSSNDVITIPPQQSVDYPFHINIPDNLTPGQYFGGLVLEEITDNPQFEAIAAASDSGKTICCTNILVKTRIGLRIYLNIPGTIKDAMQWSGFKTVQTNKSTNFMFEIKNTGNVALEPVATIEVFDSMGNQVDRFEKNLGESLPGTTINPTVTWNHQPVFGSFKAVGRLNYSIKTRSSNPADLHGSAVLGTKTANFTVVPWKEVLILLLLAMAAGIGYWVYRYNRFEMKMTWELYEIKSEDNIMKIAQDHQADWKKIAGVNKIKAPYLLKAGDKIRVPKAKNSGQQTLFDEKHHE